MSINLSITCCLNDQRNFIHGQQVVLSFTRLLLFGFFTFLQCRNTRRLQMKFENSTAVKIRGLILPRYFPFIYILGGLSLVCGIIDLYLVFSNNEKFSESFTPNASIIYLSVEFGSLQTLFEGISLMYASISMPNLSTINSIFYFWLYQYLLVYFHAVNAVKNIR